jgi:hypothetical protein
MMAADLTNAEGVARLSGHGRTRVNMRLRSIRRVRMVSEQEMSWALLRLLALSLVQAACSQKRMPETLLHGNEGDDPITARYEGR